MNGFDQQYGSRVAFAEVDYYNRSNRELVQKYRVAGHPTFVVLDKNGEVVKRFVGYTEGADLEAAIKQAAGN